MCRSLRAVPQAGVQSAERGALAHRLPGKPEVQFMPGLKENQPPNELPAPLLRRAAGREPLETCSRLSKSFRTPRQYYYKSPQLLGKDS